MCFFQKPREGVKDGGRPVVFLHGLTGSTRDWTSQVDLIKDETPDRNLQLILGRL